MGNDEGRGHNFKAEDAVDRGFAEGVGNQSIVVAGLLKQGSVNAMEDGGEIGSGAAAGVEDADGGTGEAERLIELGAEEMIDALNHVLDDFLGRVPDAEVFAELGVESFKKWLVEVGDGFVFAEGIEEGGLYAVEGFSGEVENSLKLGRVEGAGLGDFSEEFAEHGYTQIIGSQAPVEQCSGYAAFGRSTPEYPCGEDAIEEGLDEGGAEEVFALFAFKADAEGFLEGFFDGVEAGEGMVFGTGAGFAGVGGEEPGYVFGLDERGTVEHDAGEEVWEELVVFGEGGERGLPEIGWRGREGVAFEDLDRSGRSEQQQPELAKIGDEDQSVLLKIAECLRFRSEGIERVVGRLDFHDAALGVEQGLGFGGATFSLCLGEETAVGDAGSGVAELGGEQDGGLEGLADGVEETVERGVEGGLGSCRAGEADGAEIGDVLDDGVFGWHVVFNDCMDLGRKRVRGLVPGWERGLRRGRPKADPSAHHPQAEKRLGTRSLRMTSFF